MSLYGISHSDVQRCIDHCEANPACGTVDYTEDWNACHMNYIIGMETLIK